MARGAVLITGGAGFIGSHLAEALAHANRPVTVLDSFEPQVHRDAPPWQPAGVRIVRGDAGDVALLSSLLREADIEAVVHFAAQVGVGQSMYEVRRYVDGNAGATGGLLQALVDGNHAVRKLLVASSMSIYGEGAYRCPSCGPVAPPLRVEAQLRKRDWEVHCPNCGTVLEPVPTSEEKRLQANSVYAITKKAQEELCLTVGKAYGIPTVALRFFNVYGPRQSLSNPYTGVCAIFASRVKAGKPPIVFEDGKQSRDFVSVHDVVESCRLALEKSAADYEAVNVGTGHPTSIEEVALATAGAFGRPEVRPMTSGKYRPGDVRHCYADLRKVERLLEYRPKWTFERGLAELASWGRGVEAQDRLEEAIAELRSRGLER